MACKCGDCAWCDMTPEEQQETRDKEYGERVNGIEKRRESLYLAEFNRKIAEDTELYYQQNLKAGMSPEQAMRQAEFAVFD